MDSVSGSTSSPTTPDGPSSATSKNTPEGGAPGIDRTLYTGVLQPPGFPVLPADWQSEWETFPASHRSLKLFGVLHHRKGWGSDKERPVRVLLIIHGLGEHGGRYLHFPHFLQHTVDGIYCMDLRGHGRSEGLRGHVSRFDDYVEDAAILVRRLQERLRRQFGTSELHLLGHSMGGLVALRLLLLHPEFTFSSATVTAPLLGVRVKVPWIKRMAAGGLSFAAGWLQMSSGLKAESLSHDTDVVETYLKDQLVHDRVTPRYYTEMTGAVGDTVGRTSGIYVPLQMIVPLQDEIVDPDAALGFFRRLQLEEKQLRTYAGYYHEPMNEVGKEKVFEDIAKWIQKYSSTPKSKSS